MRCPRVTGVSSFDAWPFLKCASLPALADPAILLIECGVSSNPTQHSVRPMRSVAVIILTLIALSAIAADSAKAPREFVTQVLEPTGGKIQRPKSWFYTESHGGASYTWILSREDASKAPYTTGVRIQMLAGVQEGTGKSPKQFVLDYLASKKKEAKVLKTCGENDQGLFTRVCLETEEGPHHILYSLFWGNKVDLVVVSIAGTKKELWHTYANTFDRMNGFELIDMKRFEK
jgi:hypothetical protein